MLSGVIRASTTPGVDTTSVLCTMISSVGPPTVSQLSTIRYMSIRLQDLSTSNSLAKRSLQHQRAFPVCNGLFGVVWVRYLHKSNFTYICPSRNRHFPTYDPLTFLLDPAGIHRGELQIAPRCALPMEKTPQHHNAPLSHTTEMLCWQANTYHVQAHACIENRTHHCGTQVPRYVSPS